MYILTDKDMFSFFILYTRAVRRTTLYLNNKINIKSFTTYILVLLKMIFVQLWCNIIYLIVILRLIHCYIFRNIAAIPPQKCVKVSFKVMQWSLWEPFITKNKQIGVEIEWLYRSRENLSEFIQICVKSTKKWLILSLQHVNRRNFCFTQFWVLVTFSRRHHPQHHHSSRI